MGRAVKLVDRLVIGVAINAGKGPLFTLEERVAIVRRGRRADARPHAEIVIQPYEGLTDALRPRGRRLGDRPRPAGRGRLRVEFQMTAMNQQLDREIETVFLMADPRHQAIASKLVKEIAAPGRRRRRKFVSPASSDRLLAKVGRALTPHWRRARRGHYE